MKQITEDYVSFETAKLLKEKGFDESVNRFYELSTGEPIMVRTEFTRNSYTTSFACPTHQMALKWLREAHNTHIIPYFDKIQPSDLPYTFAVYIVDEYIATREIIACFDIDENLYWSKPEQAVDAALDYVLKNLI